MARLFSLLIAVVAGLPGILPAQSQYALNGAAASISSNCFRLTPNQTNQSGSVWYLNRVDISRPFDIFVNVFLGCNNGGADGMAFVLQPISTSIGGNGGGMGYQGITPSLAVEFDTYQNGNYGDPAYDHMAIMANGNVTHSSTSNLAGPVPILANSGNAEDCNYHSVRITWDTSNYTLRVFFDCNLRLTYTGNIVNTIFNGNPLVYWGFTAATGALSNEHRFCLNYISFVNALQDTLICRGDTVPLNVGTGASYSWTPAAGLSSTNISNPLAFPDTTTTYYVTVTDACQQQRRDSLTITVHDSSQLMFSLGADSTLCPGDTLPFDFSRPTVSYLWSTGSTTPTYTVRSPGSYWLSLSNRCGTLSDSINVAYELNPTVSLGPDTLLCQGTLYLLDGTFNSNTVLGTQYLWQDGSTQPIFSTSAPGLYWVEVSNYCGSARDSVMLSYLAPPAPFSLPADTVLCLGDSLLLKHSQPGVSYRWQNGSAADSLWVRGPGLYHLTVSNRCGTERDTFISTQELPPVVNLGNDTLLCNDDRLRVDISRPGYSYRWEDGSQNPLRFLPAPGLYWAEVSNICGVDRDTLLLDHETSPAPFDLGPDTSICEGETLLLQAAGNNVVFLWSDGSRGPSLEVDSAGYYWVVASNVCGSFRSDRNLLIDQPPMPDLGPDLLLCEGESQQLDVYHERATYLWQDGSSGSAFLVRESGRYWVAVSNACGTGRDTLNAIFDRPPQPANLPASVLRCEGDSVMLNATAPASPTAPVTYYWSDGETTPVRAVYYTGIYTVDVENRCGTVRRSSTLRFEDPPAPDLGPDTSRCADAGEVLYLDVTHPGASYRWHDGSAFPFYQVKAEGLYSVEVTNTCGTFADTVAIRDVDCSCTLYAPTAFTPNQDGHNDLFQVFYDCEITYADFRIYNRWGRLIYSASSLDVPWDGRSGGQDVPEGVYVWVLNYHGFLNRIEIKETRKGSVTLIR